MIRDMVDGLPDEYRERIDAASAVNIHGRDLWREIRESARADAAEAELLGRDSTPLRELERQIDVALGEIGPTLDEMIERQRLFERQVAKLEQLVGKLRARVMPSMDELLRDS